jgi:excisionase family DNA binding protein
VRADCKLRTAVNDSASEAAQFLGISTQTVYLWVERKQIPHLRVRGRNIRFLKPDLEIFRSQVIERHRPAFLRNIVQIIKEAGFRIKKELLPMRKDQIDLANATV